MPFVLWNASGLIKHYIGEPGAETADAIYAETALFEMGIAPWGYLETYSILRRRYHAGLLVHSTFKNTITALQSDVLNSGLHLIPISDSAIFAAASLIDTHHVNSADAAILSHIYASRLNCQQTIRPARWWQRTNACCGPPKPRG